MELPVGDRILLLPNRFLIRPVGSSNFRFTSTQTSTSLHCFDLSADFSQAHWMVVAKHQSHLSFSRITIGEIVSMAVRQLNQQCLVGTRDGAVTSSFKHCSSPDSLKVIGYRRRQLR